MDWRRTARWAALTGLALSLLTACTVSMSGGLLGALASIGLALLVFTLAGATQTGCVEDPVDDADEGVSTDGGTDGGVDMEIGPCLTAPPPDGGFDMEIGPCLSPPEPDFGRDMNLDMEIGPCLSAPPDQGPDMPIGPCLDIEADLGVDMEIGPCLDIAPDQGVDAAPDAELGPCLSPPPPPDPEEGNGKAQPTNVDPAAIFEKVAAGLPPDVAARLRKRV